MGSIVSGIGQYQRAESERAAAQRNEQIARWMAGDAYAQGSAQAEDTKLRGGRFMSGISAGAAHSGVDVASGSVASARETTAGMTAIDVARIINNAARRAYGYKVQAQNFHAQKDAAQTAKGLSIASTSLSTLSAWASFGAGAGGGTPASLASADEANANQAITNGQSEGYGISIGGY